MVQSSEVELVERGLAEMFDANKYDPLSCVLDSFSWNKGELKDSTGPRKWQAQQLQSLTKHLKNPETRFTPYLEAISSGHGIGKSANVAFIIHWALSCWADARVIITANTGDQLAQKTVPESKTWFRRAINSHWFDARSEFIKIKDEKHKDTWRADFVTWSIERTEAFAGLHNEGKIIVLIFDESSAIPDKIWEVAEGALTDENTVIVWLAFGNPTLNTGRFRECFGKFKHRWQGRQIDSREVEGTNKEQIAKWIEDYGEDSDFVRVRVRGEFPRAGSNQFIASDLVATARKFKCQESAIGQLPRIISVDVARFGDDQTVIGMRQGRKFSIFGTYRGIDTVTTASHTARLFDFNQGDAIIVDGDGIGGGVVDQLKAMGYDKKLGKQILHEFHGAGSPLDPKMWLNKRAEVWGAMRDWLQDGQCEIPDSPELADDLTAPQFDYSRAKHANGAIFIESKPDMKARGLSSPDLADSLAMSFAVKLANKPVRVAPKQTPVIGVWS
jgi:hypothetical protein